MDASWLCSAAVATAGQSRPCNRLSLLSVGWSRSNTRTKSVHNSRWNDCNSVEQVSPVPVKRPWSGTPCFNRASRSTERRLTLGTCPITAVILCCQRLDLPAFRLKPAHPKIIQLAICSSLPSQPSSLGSHAAAGAATVRPSGCVLAGSW